MKCISRGFLVVSIILPCAIAVKPLSEKPVDELHRIPCGKRRSSRYGRRRTSAVGRTPPRRYGHYVGCGTIPSCESKATPSGDGLGQAEGSSCIRCGEKKGNIIMRVMLANYADGQDQRCVLMTVRHSKSTLTRRYTPRRPHAGEGVPRCRNGWSTGGMLKVSLSERKKNV